MHQSTIRILREIAGICLVATLVGLTWNHRLLHSAWTGNVPTKPSAAVTDMKASPGREPAAIPLPLGLMQVKELYDRKEATIVDARDGVAYFAGHIAGAVSLPVGEADSRLAEFMNRFPHATLLVVYCNGYACQDSRNLAEKLIVAGYQTVFVFEGGLPEWQDAGYPVTGGKS
jgi:rhodanese-related sulfurtransferase